MDVLPIPIPNPPTLMAIPDFVAGLMYGLTTENHLTEIESCWTEGTVVDSDIMTGIADLHHGGWDFEIQAILEFGLAALNLPIALKTCMGMGPDIKAIESWATIFEDPAKLTATVTKHYALHRKAIKADISTTESDWALGEYYKAGVTAADLLTLAIGPIDVPTTSSGKVLPDPVGMPVRAPYEFASGFAFGFTEDNKLTAMELCYHEDSSSFKYVKKTFAAILDGDHVAAIADLAQFAESLPTDLADCKAAKIDVTAIESWAQIFQPSNRAALIADVTLRYGLHRRAIKSDIHDMKADWGLEEFYKAGVIAADLVTTAVGPVQVPATTSSGKVLPSPVGMPVRAPYEFASGFVFGFTEDNHLTELELCYHEDASSFKFAEKAIGALIDGDHVTAIADLAQFAEALPTDLADCKAAKIDVTAIESWAQIFQPSNRASLIADVTLRYGLHRRAIKSDIHNMKADWALAEFYKAGVIAADLVTTAVGPVQVPA
jgi:hypothetical protein